jgi:hypothetical protein
MGAADPTHMASDCQDTSGLTGPVTQTQHRACPDTWATDKDDKHAVLSDTGSTNEERHIIIADNMRFTHQFFQILISYTTINDAAG